MKDMGDLEGIKELIFTVRGVQVMLDRDLARLYQVQTKVLNQAVKRNISRFPERFMFQLTEGEMNELVTICDRLKPLKHSSTPATVFTEQGVTQLSAVLRSDVAVEMSIRINDAFHAMRHFLVAKVQLPLHVHDRFLIIDSQVYLLGASVKDMGKGLCAIAPVGFSPEMVLETLNGQR